MHNESNLSADYLTTREGHFHQGVMLLSFKFRLRVVLRRLGAWFIRLRVALLGLRTQVGNDHARPRLLAEQIKSPW